jgi:anti-sigma B factor antagonist
MEISHTAFKHSDLLKVTGRIDSSTAPQLAEAINQILDSGRYRVVIDMSGVSFISSAGLRVLISAQKTCRRYNRGEIVLADVPENIMAAFELAGFTPLFKIFRETLEAVGNF